MSIAQQVAEGIPDVPIDGTAYIASVYKNGTPRERSMIDTIFIALCRRTVFEMIGREYDEVDL